MYASSDRKKIEKKSGKGKGGKHHETGTFYGRYMPLLPHGQKGD
jgi:hypothetical protein